MTCLRVEQGLQRETSGFTFAFTVYTSEPLTRASMAPGLNADTSPEGRRERSGTTAPSSLRSHRLARRWVPPQLLQRLLLQRPA
jgi:hypothetical protein